MSIEFCFAFGPSQRLGARLVGAKYQLFQKAYFLMYQPFKELCVVLFIGVETETLEKFSFLIRRFWVV